MKFKTKLAIAQAKKHGIKLESVQTDKGVLHYVEELAPGVDVWIEETEGISKMADEGDYIAGAKIVHVGWGSTVVSIIDTTKLTPAAPEPEPESKPDETSLAGEKPKAEPKKQGAKLAEEAPADPKPEENPPVEDKTKPEASDMEKKYDELRTDMDDLKTSLAELFADVKDIKDSIGKVDTELSKAMKLSKSGFVPPVEESKPAINPAKENIASRFK
jgi:hypothetical protein